MVEPQFFVDLAIAAGIGGLIGVEREHREDNASVIAGIRTFPLISVAGLLIALFASELDSTALLSVGAAGAFALALMYAFMRISAGQFGMTTPLAMVVTFLLGLLVGYGYTFEAVVVGVGTTFLLLTKKRLHRFARYLDDAEMLSALQFITLLFILLPLTAALPRDLFGLPWLGRGALVDPYLVLLIVVFASTISFASLLVMRRLGPHRGIAFSGLLGGLVNSEATTASLAERAKTHDTLVAGAVVGSILATTTMLVRNLAIVGFADPKASLVWGLVPYMIPLFLVGLFLAWRASIGMPKEADPIRVKNPFAIGPALRFAALFTAASVLGKLLLTQFGDAGVYMTSLGGFVSAAAVVASVANLHATDAVTLDVALRTSLLAISASIGGKLIILRAVNLNVYQRALKPYLILSLIGIILAAAAFIFRA